MTDEDRKKLAELRGKLHSDERMTMTELAELVRLLEQEHQEKKAKLFPPQ